MKKIILISTYEKTYNRAWVVSNEKKINWHTGEILPILTYYNIILITYYLFYLLTIHYAPCANSGEVSTADAVRYWLPSGFKLMKKTT